MAFLAPIAGVAASSAGATSAGLAVASLGTALAGTGIAVYGMLQQGQAQQAAADWNAAQMRNQAIAAQYQYAQQAQEARIAAQMAEAQAGLLNAQQKQLKFQGEAIRDSASENIRRRRTEGQAFIAQQRAAYAAAGVTSAGTPLAVLSDSAGRLELDLLDIGYQAENQARDLNFQAAGLGVDIATSRFNAKSARQQASWLPKVGQYQRRSLLTEAGWTRSTGRAAGAAGNIAAAGALLQGAGNIAGDTVRYKASGIF